MRHLRGRGLLRLSVMWRINPKKTYFEQCDEIYYLISLRDAENVHNEYSTVDLTKSEEWSIVVGMSRKQEREYENEERVTGCEVRWDTKYEAIYLKQFFGCTKLSLPDVCWSWDVLLAGRHAFLRSQSAVPRAAVTRVIASTECIVCFHRMHCLLPPNRFDWRKSAPKNVL